MTEVSPGFVNTDFTNSIADVDTRAAIEARKSEFAIPPESIARVIAFAIEQPENIEIGSIVVRSTAQG